MGVTLFNGIIHAIHANSRMISSVFGSPQICNQYILTQWIIFKFKGLIEISYIFYSTLAVVMKKILEQTISSGH